jgi:hypothetical protein
MIQFNNTDHGFAIAAAIPRVYNPVADTVISRTNDEGKLLGGVIYDGCTGPCIFAHQAGFSKHWLSRDMLWILFDYVFVQLKCKKVCGTIPSSNQTLLEFNKKLGFSQEAVIKDAYPDGDMLVVSMTREQCRWLNIKPRGYQRGQG